MTTFYFGVYIVNSFKNKKITKSLFFSTTKLLRKTFHFKCMEKGSCFFTCYARFANGVQYNTSEKGDHIREKFFCFVFSLAYSPSFVKGSLTRDFLLQVFFINQCSPVLFITAKNLSSVSLSPAIIFNGCQQHWWYIYPGINDTGDIFILVSTTLPIK